MATKKITLNELRTLVKQIIKEESELNRMSSYNQDIDARLMKYAKEKEPETNWVDIKNYFMKEADPHNMKSPEEQKNSYFKLVNNFLTKHGY